MLVDLKSEHQKRVERMMVRASQELHDKPTLPKPETRKLRASLILEEAFETIQALGFEIFIKVEPTAGAVNINCFSLKETRTREDDEMTTLVDIIDGCADLIVVTTGCLSACGVPDLPILNEVDKNNLEKFGLGGYLRPDGKWVKPPGHKPPNIQGLLNELRSTDLPPKIVPPFKLVLALFAVGEA